MLHDAAPATQLGQVTAALLGSGHAQVVRDGDEERTLVKVAGLGASFDLEHRAAGRGGVDHVTVVDDTFEDGQGADAHLSVLAQLDR